MLLLNKKIGTRLFEGFLAVVVLSAVVAYVGFRGLTGVVDRVDKRDGVNILVKELLDTRLLENAYIITDDSTYAVEVEKKVNQIIAEAQRIKGKFKQKTNKEQMDLVIKQANEYLDTFKGYVELDRQREQTNQEMQALAQEALAQIESIGSDQRAQLNKGYDDSDTFLAQKMANAADANQVIKLYIDTRMNEKEFIDSGGKKLWKDAADEGIDKILSLTADMKTRFKNPRNIEQIEGIRTGVLAYGEALSNCSELIHSQFNTKAEMGKKGLIAKEKIYAIRSSQSDEIMKVVGNLDIDREDFSSFLNKRLDKADKANQLVGLFIDVQMYENEYIFSNGGSDWRNKIHENLDRILELAKQLKASLRMPKMRRQINEAIDSVEAYGKAFDRFEQLMQGLNNGLHNMNTLAIEVMQKAETIREDQNNQLDDARKTNATFMDEKTANSNEANQIVKWFIEAQKSEKEFVLSGGQKQFQDDVKNKIGRILDLSAILQSRLGVSVNQEQINKVITAVTVYDQAFDNFVSMLQRQDKMNQTMLTVARKTEKAFADVLNDQKIKMEKQMSSAMRLIGSVTAVVIFVGVLLAWVISKGITKPLSMAAARLKDIAEGDGDLTTRLEIKTEDEVGELAVSFNTFVGKLQEIIKDVKTNTDTLNSSSKELSQLSSQMSEGVGNMSEKSNAVAVSSEEMSANMSNVALSMEQAAVSINMVAASTEEMTSTVNEIAQNSEKARNITDKAVSQAKVSLTNVDSLGRAANEIGKVTEAITEISEQTNLLALNATIEAARAGEAGKGFAVVANEIKDLAKQTADATQGIREKIISIQKVSATTMTEIEQIAKVISDVDGIVSFIATAVEEQSVTTKEIAGNAAKASQGIQEVNSSVAQSSKVSEDMAKDISQVSQAANEMSHCGIQVDANSSELSALADRLRSIVVQFKLD